MNAFSSKANEKLRQFFAVALALAMTVVLSGIATVISANAADLPEGSLIKTADAPEVYIINDKANGQYKGWKRHIFNPEVFNMYGQFGWDDINIVPQSTLDMYKTSDLYRSDVDTRVYALEEQGSSAIKRHIQDEAAFAANGYSWDQIFTVNEKEVNYYATGPVITASTPSNPSTPPVVTGGVTVALASDSPASGAVVAGQGLANLAKYTFTNGSSSDVKVTGIVLNRTGISVDTTLSSVYLFNGNTRLTDSASVSAGKITFNNASGILTIPANSSVTVDVKSNIAASTAGQIVGVALASVTSDTTVAASYPIAGSQFTVAASTLATAYWGSSNPTPSSNVSIDPQSDYKMWEQAVNIGTRDVILKSFRLREIGSINFSDLRNFNLYVDGTKVGSTVSSLDSDGYVVFDLSDNPVTLKTGSRTLKMTGDVIGGSDRNFSFSLREASDIDLVDSELNASVLSAVSSSATFTTKTTGTITVNSGTLTITKTTDSPSGNITLDGSGLTLAKFEFKAAGESMKVENLRVAIDDSANETAYTLRNGAIFANGVQIGSSASIAGASDQTLDYTEFALGSSLVVVPGSPVIVEIRADVYDDDGSNDVVAGTTIVGQLVAGSSNVQRLTSLGFIGSDAKDGNTLTVSTGSMSLSKYQAYADQSVVSPQTAYKLAEFRLTSTDTEAINLNTLTVAITSSTTDIAVDLSDIYVVYGSKTTSLKSTVAASNVWNISGTLASSDSMEIAVYANINSTALNTDYYTTKLTVAGTTVDSATSVTGGQTTGQTMTIADGSISSAVSASRPDSTLLVQSTTAKVASFKFTATNETYTITDLAVKVGSNDAASVIQSITLKDGNGTVLKSNVPLDGLVATSSSLSLTVPANQNVVVDAFLNLAAVGTGAATSGANVMVTLDGFKADNSNGVESADYTDRAGQAMYVYKTIPTISNVNLPSTILETGTKVIAKFAVSSDSQPITWKKITLNTTKTDGFTIATGSSMKLYDASTDIEVPATLTASNFASGDTSGTITFVLTNEQEVSGSKTYYVKTTIAGTVGSGDNISTNITRPSSYAASNTYAVVAATSASFVWSDQSLVGHSASTADWNNDSLLRNLPSDSQTLRY